jgi:hypothetical protein
MSNIGTRLAIPGVALSIAPTDVWSVPPVPRELAPEMRDALGAYLLHIPSGVQLNVRLLPERESLSAAHLEETFARYAALAWPGPCRTETFSTAGALRGVTGVFEGAMPDAIVREWLVTDGTRLANAATFATVRQWDDILQDCETLVRSIRFE